MPVTYGTYQKQMKLLPLTLNDDGSASVVVRYGFVDETGIFDPVTAQTFNILPADVSTVLDAAPTAGLSRRDDLSFAIYTYLVTSGLIAQGTIS